MMQNIHNFRKRNTDGFRTNSESEDAKGTKHLQCREIYKNIMNKKRRKLNSLVQKTGARHVPLNYTWHSTKFNEFHAGLKFPKLLS
jgi:hypothetical protein